MLLKKRLRRLGVSWIGFKSWYAVKQPDIVLLGEKKSEKKKKKERKKEKASLSLGKGNMKVCGVMPKAKEYFTKTTTPVICYYLCCA